MSSNFSEINCTCEKCGDVIGHKYEDGQGGWVIMCPNCLSVVDKELAPGVMPQKTVTVTCPFCQSTDCKKISGASKIGKVALFGVFAAGSVSKTWHCNNCGSNFG